MSESPVWRRLTADFDLIVRGGTVVTADGRRPGDVAIRGGRFAAIDPPGSLMRTSADEVLDASGLLVLPGLIDGHVHFRSPGLEHEEDWLTGTRAAVMGGVTTVLDMPNTFPPTDTPDHARAKLALAQASAYCDFGIFGLLGPSVESVAALAKSGLIVGFKAFLGPTTGGLVAPTGDDLGAAMEVARDAGLRVAFHAEDAETILADAARPVEAEVIAIDRVGALLLSVGAKGHVLHVSSADGLAAIEKWRERGVDLTAEATPHHLLLDDAVHARFGGLAKVYPPIRGAEHRDSLWTAFSDGRIDVCGSDHAPHLLADKQRESLADVPAGFAGVETLLPLLLAEVAEGRLTLERLVSATSQRPARIWGLWPRKGTIAVGSDADLVIVDPHRDGVIRAADLHGKNNHSPFEGRSTRGAPMATIVRGTIVVRDGVLVGAPGWARPVQLAP